MTSATFVYLLSPITLQSVPHLGFGLGHHFCKAKIERELGLWGTGAKPPRKASIFNFREFEIGLNVSRIDNFKPKMLSKCLNQ